MIIETAICVVVIIGFILFLGFCVYILYLASGCGD